MPERSWFCSMAEARLVGVIQYGSRYLSDTETRYAVIELELLAVVWAVRKCTLFLSGARSTLITDHCPLIPIINAYTLDQIESPRLLRLMIKLQSFQIQAVWRKGTDNAFAEALSRNPVVKNSQKGSSTECECTTVECAPAP